METEEMKVYKEHIQLVGLVVMLSGSSLLVIGMLVNMAGNDTGNALLIPGAVMMFLVGMVVYMFGQFINSLQKEVEALKKGEQKW
jgi:hypothetical protein